MKEDKDPIRIPTVMSSSDPWELIVSLGCTGIEIAVTVGMWVGPTPLTRNSFLRANLEYSAPQVACAHR